MSNMAPKRPLQPRGSIMDITAEKIANAARDCFFQFGYKKTSLVMIADLAGVSRATLYNYFDNKEELFKTVMSIFRDARLAQSLELLQREPDYWRRIKQIIHLWVVSPFEFIGNDLVIEDLTHTAKQVNAVHYEESERQVRDLMEKITWDAAENGQITLARGGLSCKEIADTVILMVTGLIVKSHKDVRKGVAIIIRALKAILREAQ